ncbi:MAG: sugar transferase [Paludibacteraceae bacterium]|nr:sugar transferase [Paludibacteraceae bacterium]
MKYWNRRKKYQLIYMLVDFMSAMLVWMAFLLFRWLVYEGRMFSVDTVLIPMFNFYWPLVLYPLGCLFVYYLSGYYLRPLRRPYSRELRRTLVSSLIISVGAFFLIVIDDPINGHYDRYLTSLLVLFVLQFVGCYLPRLLVTYIAHTFDDRAPRRYTIRSKDEVIEFEKAHAQQAYDEVILDLKSKNKEEEMYMLISRLYPANVEISVVPSLYDMLTGAAVIADVADQPLIPITEHKMNDAGLCIKRAFDVVVSLMALILLSPIYILVAIAVWSTSSGPIFYLQERIGLHGIPFKIIKFRTMRMHAEKDMPQLSLHNDPRVTRVGKFLRKYRLDELPQFWNILRGEMSIVGPRPERRYFINQIEEQAPYYCMIYKIRPGLTSWGPIKVGYTDTLEKMIRRLNYDIVYVENMSLGLDLKIMFYTLGVIFKGKGR